MADPMSEPCRKAACLTERRCSANRAERIEYLEREVASLTQQIEARDDIFRTVGQAIKEATPCSHR